MKKILLTLLVWAGLVSGVAASEGGTIQSERHISTLGANLSEHDADMSSAT